MGSNGNDKTIDQNSGDLERSTLCISTTVPGLTLHGGDKGFASLLKNHYSPHEALANEKLCNLKKLLPGLSTDEFWTTLMEGITEITGSQYALAVKRILPEDVEIAVEMPELGEPGQCLMATAFFYNDGAIHRRHVRDYKYYPYSGPCGHMKHDKVFVIPSDLANFIGEQINKFAFPVETYIGIPLFSSKGECIGHFGALWSDQGMKERKLSWGFVEIALHALEDITARKLLEGQSFKKRPEELPTQVIPKTAVTAVQSLKPYARSLSHELRTPMQGVVGMLDIMHATVSEALETPLRSEIVRVFRMLRENIELVQDSSRRAIEAADNVVHAYAMNMQVPETPHNHGDEEDGHEAEDYIKACNASPGQDFDRKRKRGDSGFSPSKHIAMDPRVLPPRPLTPHTAEVRSLVRESSHITGVTRPSLGDQTKSEYELLQVGSHSAAMATRIRGLTKTVVNECLRCGGRPDSAIAEETGTGEVIEVRTRDNDGQIWVKWVEWAVDSSVPDEILVDARDYTKLISVLVLNAIKFTHHGRVRLSASLSSRSRYLVITVLDTGTGIPAEFIPNLFKAFSRQDDTITRQSEGLGLGLLVAKGIARRLGGDLTCVRSNTEGPNQGSEFELRLPLSPSDAVSRASSPSRTSTPSRVDEDRNLNDIKRSASYRSSRDQVSELSTSPTFPKPDQEEVPPPSSPTTAHLCRSPPRHSHRDPDPRRNSVIRPVTFDKKLAQKYPLRFLVAEDNRINRKLLVSMLGKLGYTAVYEAYDGAEAVRLMEVNHRGGNDNGEKVDVILMDLWMPNMDGYEAARRILAKEEEGTARSSEKKVKILAVTADITDGALERAKEAGMRGFMTKPYKLLDLEKLIVEHCANGT